MNTRRQFLLTAPLGVLAATSACGTPGPSSSGPTPMSSSCRVTLDPRRAADLRHGTGQRAAGVGGDVRRSGEAGAGHDAARGSRAGGVELAAIAGAAARAADRAAQGRARAGGRARHDLDAVAHRRASGRRRATRSCAAAPAPRPLPSSDADIAFAPVTRALALDRAEAAHVGSAHAHLSAAHRRARSRSCGR